jgi:hypothetical protein
MKEIDLKKSVYELTEAYPEPGGQKCVGKSDHYSYWV